VSAPTVRLADVTTRIGSGITPRGGSAVYKTSGRPFVRSQNIGWGELRLADLAYIDDETHMTFPATEIRTGDVLLNITGASIGRSAVATSELRGGNVNQHVCEIRLMNDVMDPHYLKAVLISRIGQNQIDTFQAGGNREGLNFQQVGSIRVPALDIHQQRAIGVAVKDADRMIAVLERMVFKKQAVKQGMMQQLLTGKTHLPGFAESWSTSLLGTLGTFLKGRGVKREDVRNSGVRCVRYGELYTVFDEYTYETISFVSPEVANSALPLKTGDLLFAGSGETREEIGKCVAYVGPTPAVAGGDVIVLRGDQFNPAFLGLLCNTAQVTSQMTRAGQGDAVVHIYSHALSAIEVTVPSRPEQDAIAKAIVDANREIKLLRSRLIKARDIRQGMMQELLTGRTRLPVEESAA